MNESLFHETTMSINKEDYLKIGDNSQSKSDIINTNIKLTMQCLLKGIYKLWTQSQKMIARYLINPIPFESFTSDR